MDDQKNVEHQIELANRLAAATLDETTAGRLRRFAEELRERLFTSSKSRRIRARAYELWEEAGRPPGRDWDFWLQAEAEIEAGGKRST